MAKEAGHLLKYFEYFEGKMRISFSATIVSLPLFIFAENTVAESLSTLVLIASSSCFLAGMIGKASEKLEQRKCTGKVSQIESLRKELMSADKFLARKILKQKIRDLDKNDA